MTSESTILLERIRNNDPDVLEANLKLYEFHLRIAFKLVIVFYVYVLKSSSNLKLCIVKLLNTTELCKLSLTT